MGARSLNWLRARCASMREARHHAAGAHPMLLWTCLLLLAIPCAESAVGDAGGSQYEISAPLTLPNEIFVTYGSGALLQADLRLGISDRESILPGCERVQLVAVVNNDRANFDLPGDEASLEIDPVCLECREGAGGPVRVDGRVSGIELRGSHMHDRMIGTHDLFGLYLPAGASGLAELNREPGQHETCFRRREPGETEK